MKEYTDDEIKLIYNIDPYGLVAYVKEYAENNHETGCSVQEMLEGTLGYKDEIFELLFKRTPKYYARNSVGNWHETTDKSDLKAVISESEYIFGFHALWDTTTIYEILSTAFDLLVSLTGIDSTELGESWVDLVDTYLKKWAGKSSFNLQDVVESFVEEKVNDEIEEDFGEEVSKKISRWTTYISFVESLGELQEVFSDRPDIYSTMLQFSSDYNNNDIKYNIVFKLANGKIYSARELYYLI